MDAWRWVGAFFQSDVSFHACPFAKTDAGRDCERPSVAKPGIVARCLAFGGGYPVGGDYLTTRQIGPTKLKKVALYLSSCLCLSVALLRPKGLAGPSSPHSSFQMLVEFVSSIQSVTDHDQIQMGFGEFEGLNAA